MTLLTNAFELKPQQGILVLTPKGDSLSYRDVDIQREATEIQDYLQKNRVKKLVVNLSRSNYFSSLMIGIINSIGQEVKSNHGQMVICEASDEMKKILKVMKVDTLWPIFPNLLDAIKVAKAWQD